jgi:hypothetical protein
MLAAAAVAVLAAGVGPVRLGSGPPANGPTAPRQFNPLVPYLSFGWLPAGNRLVAGDARPEVVALVAGRKLYALSNWDLSVYAAGQCHLIGPAGELKCSTPALEGLTARITGHAPAVLGHRAFWAGPYLVWQYARSGWAWLMLPTANASPKLSAAKREAYKRDGSTPLRNRAAGRDWHAPGLVRRGVVPRRWAGWLATFTRFPHAPSACSSITEGSSGCPPGRARTARSRSPTPGKALWAFGCSVGRLVLSCLPADADPR